MQASATKLVEHCLRLSLEMGKFSKRLENDAGTTGKGKIMTGHLRPFSCASLRADTLGALGERYSCKLQRI